MMKSYFQKRILRFINPAGTSRGVLLQKEAWFIYLYEDDAPVIKGIGEVSFIPGLSKDDPNKIEEKITEVCSQINKGTFNFEKAIVDFPGINFAIETANRDFNSKGDKIIFPSLFTDGKMGIRTNGLVWMGSFEEMSERIAKKLVDGFKCIKIKIGAININQELTLLANLRRKFSPDELEIRVDANGAFTYKEALPILYRLKELGIHSIEQPIIPNQLSEMAAICKEAPIPVALDEELIGITPYENKRKLVEIIRPQYLVLKPGLLGGFKEATDWINIADEFDISWWVTSALESNLGLNAIAQWVATFNNHICHGLGLGNLYQQNVEAPLSLRGEELFYNPDQKWSLEFLY